MVKLAFPRCWPLSELWIEALLRSLRFLLPFLLYVMWLCPKKAHLHYGCCLRVLHMVHPSSSPQCHHNNQLNCKGSIAVLVMEKYTSLHESKQRRVLLRSAEWFSAVFTSFSDIRSERGSSSPEEWHLTVRFRYDWRWVWCLFSCFAGKIYHLISEQYHEITAI